jgi:hypothetical protein
MIQNNKNSKGSHEPNFKFHGSRRSFIAFGGASIAAKGLFLAGCNKDDEDIIPPAGPLAAPGGLAADNATQGQIILTWTDNSNDEDGFRIERSTTQNSGFTQIAEVDENVTTYTDSNIEEGTEYFYRVRAFRGTENSTYTMVVSSTSGTAVVNLGQGDVGILNYAYALEQLEAAFYTSVMAGGYYSAASEEEKQIISDLQKHEVIHREFFKAALTGAAPNDIIPTLEFDFSAVNFDERASVLGTAKVFEDLGVSAYNGAGQFLENTDFLVLAGKIVSVEARHASAIRDLLNPDSMDFAGDDIVNAANGLEITRSFADVLAAASGFITTEIDGSGLPSGGIQFTV